MSHEKRPLGIYIDLDCILDTRMGTLATIDPDRAIPLLEDIRYYHREIDEFPNFTKEEFEKVYSNRDMNILAKSTITNLIFDLQEIINDLYQETLSHPLYYGIKVFLNIHPYTLYKEDANEIKRALEFHLFGEERVEMVNSIEIIDIPLEQLDCLYIYNNLNHLFIYHYPEWLNARLLEFLHKGLPEVCVYFPRINQDYVPDKEDIKKEIVKANLDVEDHFHFIEEFYRMFIQIRFIPIEAFCVVNNHYHLEE